MKKIISGLLAIVMTLSAISGIALANSDPHTVVDETFEDYNLGTNLSELGSVWEVTTDAAGSSVTIEKDTLNNTKAVKITQTRQATPSTSNLKTGFKVNLNKISTGVVDIKFKLRIEGGKTANLYEDLLTGNWKGTGSSTSMSKIAQWGNGWYVGVGTGAVDATKAITTVVSDEYQDINIIVDMDNKTASINGLQTNFGNASELWTLNFLISAFSGGAQNAELDTTATNNPVYWIDDISIIRYGIKLTGKSIANNASDVELNTPIKGSFNENVDSSTVLGNVKVYENNNELAVDKFTATASGKDINVEIIGGMNYNTKYKVEFLENIKCDKTGYLPLGKKETMEFTTKKLFAALENVTNGGSYDQIAPKLPTVASDIILTATLKNPQGQETAFVSETMLTDIGEYTLTVTGTDANGKTQTDIYIFEVVGLQPPEAKSVLITVDGTLNANSVLNGGYQFFDINGDERGTSLYQWYISDSLNGKYEKIPGEEGMSLSLSSGNYKNKYFKFSVIPVALSQPYTGEETFSLAFAGYFDPVAENVTIENRNNVLFASYTHKDENNQTKTEPGYQWYKKGLNDADFSPIIGETSDTYTLDNTEDNVDYQFCVGIVPKKISGEGEEAFSEPVYGLMKPVVEAVKINGDARVGQSIYVSYLYSDKNGDDAGTQKIQWYVDSNPYSVGETLQLTSSMSGKSVYAEVTPVSVKYPYEGKTEKTGSVTVSEAIIQGGGGGGGSASSIFIPASKPEENTENKAEDKTDDVPESIVFDDIESHWAKDDILYMYEKGIVDGVGEGEFSPDTSVTRAQFAKMIVLIFANLPKGEAEEFTDVEIGKWYDEYVMEAAAKGLMSGAGGKFRPDDDITREEICVVMLNGLQQEGIITNLDFADADKISDWAKNAVGYAYENGIVNGKDGSFCPQDAATRAESLVMIKRLMDLMEAEYEK